MLTSCGPGHSSGAKTIPLSITFDFATTFVRLASIVVETRFGSAGGGSGGGPVVGGALGSGDGVVPGEGGVPGGGDALGSGEGDALEAGDGFAVALGDGDGLVVGVGVGVGSGSGSGASLGSGSIAARHGWLRSGAWTWWSLQSGASVGAVAPSNRGSASDDSKPPPVWIVLRAGAGSNANPHRSGLMCGAST